MAIEGEIDGDTDGLRLEGAAAEGL